METASLIFLVLLVEFVYDPLATIRNELLIKKSYGIFNNFSKQYIENKFLVYMSFILFCILATIIIKAFLEGYIHWVLSALLYYFIAYAIMNLLKELMILNLSLRIKLKLKMKQF